MGGAARTTTVAHAPDYKVKAKRSSPSYVSLAVSPHKKRREAEKDEKLSCALFLGDGVVAASTWFGENLATNVTVQIRRRRRSR